MQIAFVTELFHPQVGGMETRHTCLAKSLAAQGHEITVFTVRLSPKHAKSEIIDNVKIVRIHDSFHYLNGWMGARNLKDVILFTAKALLACNKLGHLDAVILSQYPIFPALVLPWLLKSKVILDWCELIASKSWSTIYRLMTIKTQLHTTVSQPLTERIIAFGVPAHRVTTMLSGSAERAITPVHSKKTEKQILVLGRLRSHKNTKMAIDAFCLSHLHESGFQLVIAGDGPLYQELKNDCANVPGISFLGPISHEAKIHLLATSSLLVVPSKREGFSVVTAEAALYGTPTLTVDFPNNGTADVVRHYGLGWVSPPNVKILAQMMRDVATAETPEWLAASRRCLEMSRQFSWSEAATVITKLTSATQTSKPSYATIQE